MTRINAKDELNKSTNIIFLANPSKKVNIDYLHLNKKFGEGKLGIMYKILNRLEASDMAKYFKLEFKSHEATPIKIDDKIKEQCELRIKAKMREKRINLFASNDVDKSLLEILQNAIQKDNIFVQISDKIDENALNLRLIHNKNYYEKQALMTRIL